MASVRFLPPSNPFNKHIKSTTKVSQKEKDKYRTLMRTVESRKTVLMNVLQGSRGDADIENRLVGTAEEGERVKVKVPQSCPTLCDPMD